MADEDQNKRESHEEDGRAADQDPHVRRRKRIGRLVGITIMAATVLVVILVWQKMTLYPRTQDASVGAYYIGMAPEVEGRVIALHVRDNGCVEKGQLLVEIDSAQY